MSGSRVADIDSMIDLIGAKRWAARMTELVGNAAGGQRSGQALIQRHGIELTLERLRRTTRAAATQGERCLCALAGRTTKLMRSLPVAGRERLREALRAALVQDATLVPAFHLLRTAMLQEARGFEVGFAGLADGAPFDLLIWRDGVEAEIACDVVSAEEGRDVHRGAWTRLVDHIDPDLQTWLESHPGRYLLKLTLPQGLRTCAEGQPRLAALQTRIRAMLESSRRADYDEAAVLRLDPLMLAAAQAGEPAGGPGLMPSLRREFGPEAHLAVTSAGEGVFVLAARAGRENEVAAAIRRRLAAIAPVRLTGTRPGILAMFIEDTDRTEWRQLRDKLEIEGETRNFLTNPEARGIVAVTCCSRLELLGAAPPDAAAEGELRFRNHAHPAARLAGLAPAVCSTV